MSIQTVIAISSSVVLNVEPLATCGKNLCTEYFPSLILAKLSDFVFDLKKIKFSSESQNNVRRERQFDNNCQSELIDFYTKGLYRIPKRMWLSIYLSRQHNFPSKFNFRLVSV